MPTILPRTRAEAIEQVRRFLDANYPCGCEGDDLVECPGNIHEAGHIVSLVLGDDA